VSTVWAGQQWNRQVAGARDTVYGSDDRDQHGTSAVQQRSTATRAHNPRVLCDRGQAEKPGEAAAVLGRADVLHRGGQGSA